MKKKMIAMHKAISKDREKRRLEPLKYHIMGYPYTIRFTLREILGIL